MEDLCLEKDRCTCLYFAYGTNMLLGSLLQAGLIVSPKRVSIGRLDNHRLQFIKYSHYWGGPTMTMVPTANAHIWGCIWRLRMSDFISIDEQNRVDMNVYYPLYVEVETPHMGTLICRAYRQKLNPLPRGDNDIIPVENWPSLTYKYTLIFGAIESGLPEYYIEQLKQLPDNGDEGCLRMMHLLYRYGHDKPCGCIVPGRIPRKPLKWSQPVNEKKEKHYLKFV